MVDSQRLPPFTALRGFEAAARLQSFRAAADELCLTPSAISHHVRQLEEFVGNPLFERNHKGVVLTRSGRSYLADLAPVFDSLERATAKVKQEQPRQQITMRSSPGFSARWLMPRLRHLNKCIPDADLTVTTNDTVTSNVDIEFICAFTYPLEEGDEVLLSSARAPVCNRQYLEEFGPIQEPLQLKDLTLLRENQYDSWDDWFSIAAPGHSVVSSELWFDDGYASMNAAELGLGVQLGYLELLSNELADGSLVQLFDQTLPKRTLFTLRMKSGWQDDPNLTSIRNWLMEQMHDAEKSLVHT